VRPAREACEARQAAARRGRGPQGRHVTLVTIVPLGGLCLAPLLRASAAVRARAIWLPPSTLGVHVRRGNLDAAWRRGSGADWVEAVAAALEKHGLKHVFVASDDEHVYAAFQARFPSNVLLPRFEPLRKARSFSRNGNVAALAEQLTLGSADRILGTREQRRTRRSGKPRRSAGLGRWGSTYSS